MSPTPHKLASEKQVTCKIISQTSEAPTTQIMIFMSQQATDPNSATEDKWKALVWAELSVLLLQDTKESATPSEWPES